MTSELPDIANSGSISLYALWDKGNWYSCAIFMCSAKDNIEMCRSMESVKGMSGVGAGGHHCPHLSAGVERGVVSDRLSNVVFIGESKFSGTWGRGCQVEVIIHPSLSSKVMEIDRGEVLNFYHELGLLHHITSLN
ncbi:Uncharacterized protein Fot_40727 [Forsythia ovata]|uniref:Uncharacterized protein n=1 Tax=Forsythia ovata TaxID=205694 RepID=A0ABD1S8G8_9LAMI